MPYYRCVNNLSFGGRRVKRGEIVKLDGALAEKLLNAKAISVIRTPPLAVLPGWVLRAERMATIGVLTGEDFLNADIQMIADLMNVRPETVKRWRKDLIDTWLVVRPGESG